MKYLSAAFAFLVVLILSGSSFSQSRRARIAVLDFGSSRTSSLVDDSIRAMFAFNGSGASKEFELVDRDLAISAARGLAPLRQLNMSTQEARDLGAAIGCEFYFAGEAQTVRRSSSARPIYYETYAAIFLVSARTGRLVLWERPAAEGDQPEESSKHFMIILAAAKARYISAVRKALQDEHAERASVFAGGVPVIEVLSGNDAEKDKDLQPPRPYRRLKPPYPETAARAEVEATVDALVDVDAQGEVARVEIARWAGYGLDESVVATVRQMHFFPARRNGQAVPLRVLLRYNFRKQSRDDLPNQLR